MASRVTYCPLCTRPLTESESGDHAPGEYPAHAACRARMQRLEEEADACEQEREYRGRERDAAEYYDDSEEPD